MVSSIGSGGGFDIASLKKMWQKTFNKIDENGDGKLDKDEVTKFIANNSTNSTDGPSVSDIFSALDSNQDGAINQLESDAAIAKLGLSMQQNGPPPMMSADSSSDMKDKMFTEADTNGDGTISKDEMAAMLAKGPQGGPGIDEIFSKMDTNQDGSISKSESDAAIDEREAMKPSGPPPKPMTSSGTSSEDQNSLVDDLLKAIIAANQSSSTSTTTSSTTSTTSSTTDQTNSSTELGNVLGYLLKNYLASNSSSLYQGFSNSNQLTANLYA